MPSNCTLFLCVCVKCILHYGHAVRRPVNTEPRPFVCLSACILSILFPSMTLHIRKQSTPHVLCDNARVCLDHLFCF